MIKNKYFATSYAINPMDLYLRFQIKKKLSNLVKGWWKIDYMIYFGRMLKYLFYLIILDIIENNVTFKFPPGCSTYLEMVPIHGEEFKRARQNGAFDDVDFLASNFTGYQIYLRYNTRYGHWLKQIYVSRKWKNRITELTNAGKHYG